MVFPALMMSVRPLLTLPEAAELLIPFALRVFPASETLPTSSASRRRLPVCAAAKIRSGCAKMGSPASTVCARQSLILPEAAELLIPFALRVCPVSETPPTSSASRRRPSVCAAAKTRSGCAKMGLPAMTMSARRLLTRPEGAELRIRFALMVFLALVTLPTSSASRRSVRVCAVVRTRSGCARMDSTALTESAIRK